MHVCTDVQVPLSNGGVAIVDEADFAKVSGHRWYWKKSYPTARTAYAYAHLSGSRSGKLMLHRFLMDAPKGLEVDHINRNGLDCTRRNMRLVTHAENQRNKAGKRGTSSRFKGVAWSKAASKWVATIGTNGKTKHLGTFATEVQAARAYDAAARLLFKNFARLNFDVEPLTQATLF